MKAWDLIPTLAIIAAITLVAWILYHVYSDLVIAAQRFLP